MLTQSIWWAISSTVGGSRGHGIGRKPTTTSSRRYCARSAKERASSMSPAITMNGCAITRSCSLAAWRWRKRLFTSLPMDAGYWCCMETFDAVVKHARWLALLGDKAYTAALWFNRYFNTARRRLGYQYWSLSAYLKHRVKNAMQYIGSFADAVAAEAQRRGVDGVICGHIHHAEIRDINGVLYGNDGDWVESCTALVEHYDGRIELIDWIEHSRSYPRRGRVVDELDSDMEARLPELVDTVT